MKSLHNKHKGKPFFILGCGCSINWLDLTLIDPFISIGVNRIVYAYHPTYWMFIDHPIVKEFGKKIDLRIIGSQILCWSHAKHNTNGAMVFEQSKNRRCNKLERGYNGLTFGHTTTFTAMHMAYIMGASSLVLCGVDLCFHKGMCHFYDTEPELTRHGKKRVTRSKSARAPVQKIMVTGRKVWTRNDFIRMAKSIGEGAAFLESKGVKVYNTSNISIIDKIPYTPLEDVITKIS